MTNITMTMDLELAARVMITLQCEATRLKYRAENISLDEPEEIRAAAYREARETARAARQFELHYYDPAAEITFTEPAAKEAT